jgi:hypothetical protein
MAMTPKDANPEARALSALAAAARAKASEHDSEPNADVGKGAVEDDQPHAAHNTSMRGQLGHRSNTAQSRDPQSSDAELKDSDSDYPEPGSSPEHSGQHR